MNAARTTCCALGSIWYQFPPKQIILVNMNQQPAYTIRAITANDHAFIAQFITNHWGAPTAIAHNTVYVVSDLPGYIATIDDEVVGLITYSIEQNACEIVTIDSLLPA